eukprot:scaffold34505_cov124-Isochrysis_galbana.AAC.2
MDACWELQRQERPLSPPSAASPSRPPPREAMASSASRREMRSRAESSSWGACSKSGRKDGHPAGQSARRSEASKCSSLEAINLSSDALARLPVPLALLCAAAMMSCTTDIRHAARSDSGNRRQRRRSHCSTSAHDQRTVGVATCAPASASSSRHGPALHQCSRTAASAASALAICS